MINYCKTTEYIMLKSVLYAFMTQDRLVWNFDVSDDKDPVWQRNSRYYPQKIFI